MACRWDLSEPESPEWLQGPLKAAEGERAFEEDAARQLRLENAGLQVFNFDFLFVYYK